MSQTKSLSYIKLAAGREVRPQAHTPHPLAPLFSRLRPLIQSPIEGYGPRPQASARLARAAAVPQAVAQAIAWTRTARQRITRGDFLGIGNFAPFSEFLHIKGRNFLTCKKDIAFCLR